MKRALIATSGFALSVLLSSSAFTEGRPITLDDLRSLCDLSDPQVSPDGKRITVVVSRPDYEDNRFENELLLVDVGTGTQVVLTHDRPHVSSPRWSHDGERLAFLDRNRGSEEEKPQIFVLSMQGGEARRITDAPSGVSLFAWRPDGKGLAYVTQDVPEKKTGEERHNKSFEVGDNVYLASEAPLPSHLWLVSSEGGDARQLPSGSGSVASDFGGSIAWSPDGRSLVFAAQDWPHPAEFDRRNLRLLEVETAALRTLVSGPAPLSGARFSPRGDELAYSYPTGPEPGFNPDAVFVVSAAGGEPRNATASLDRDVAGDWLADGSLILWGYDGTRVSLWRQPRAGSPAKIATGAIDTASSLSAGPTGLLAFVGVEPKTPEELYVLDAPGATPRRLTSLNADVASRNLGETETLTWKGPDEFVENGVLTYPPDFDRSRKYPLVLDIHGGPMGTSLEGFSAFRHILASKGWIVFSPNYRGSNNMGDKFQSAVINDAGDGPGRDVMSGVAELKKRGMVDESADGGVGLVVRRVHDRVAHRALPGLEGRGRGRRRDRLVRLVQHGRHEHVGRVRAGRVALDQRQRDELLEAVADGVRAPDQDADADPLDDGRSAGDGDAVVQAVSRAQGQRDHGAVHRVSGRRALSRRIRCISATCIAVGLSGSRKNSLLPFPPRTTESIPGRVSRNRADANRTHPFRIECAMRRKACIGASSCVTRSWGLLRQQSQLRGQTVSSRTTSREEPGGRRRYRLTPEFTAPLGKYDWLNKGVFIANLTTNVPNERRLARSENENDRLIHVYRLA